MGNDFLASVLCSASYYLVWYIKRNGNYKKDQHETRIFLHWLSSFVGTYGKYIKRPKFDCRLPLSCFLSPNPLHHCGLQWGLHSKKRISRFVAGVKLVPLIAPNVLKLLILKFKISFHVTQAQWPIVCISFAIFSDSFLFLTLAIVITSPPNVSLGKKGLVTIDIQTYIKQLLDPPTLIVASLLPADQESL